MEPTGADTEIHAQVDSADVVAVFRERQKLRPGDVISLSPAPEFTHLFDEGSGKAMRQ
ncbi:hypothetical protein CDEF62S_04540 [Castellaniella defragrans]